MQGFIRDFRQIGHFFRGALRAPGQECEEMQGFVRGLRQKGSEKFPARFARRARKGPRESENSFFISITDFQFPLGLKRVQKECF